MARAINVQNLSYLFSAYISIIKLDSGYNKAFTVRKNFLFCLESIVKIVYFNSRTKIFAKKASEITTKDIRSN